MFKIQHVDNHPNLQNLNQSYARGNPFIDATLVKNYEAWYATGRRADRLEKVLLKRLLQAFPGAHTLLEIGCGTAHFTRWFESIGLQTIGLDSSQLMLAEAMSLSSPPCIQGDTSTMPLVSDSFDLVAIITTLEFLSVPLECLAEALRVSRQGLILGVLNSRSKLEKQLKMAENHPWSAAHFFTVSG